MTSALILLSLTSCSIDSSKYFLEERIEKIYNYVGIYEKERIPESLQVINEKYIKTVPCVIDSKIDRTKKVYITYLDKIVELDYKNYNYNSLYIGDTVSVEIYNVYINNTENPAYLHWVLKEVATIG